MLKCIPVMKKNNFSKLIADYNIPIFLNANFLITVHDLWHLIDKSWKRFYRRLYSKIMFFVISKKNSSIIAVSNFTKNEIISNTKIKNNISVIKHGVEKHWISTKSFKKNKDILFVGNIRNHKNIFYQKLILIRGAARATLLKKEIWEKNGSMAAINQTTLAWQLDLGNWPFRNWPSRNGRNQNAGISEYQNASIPIFKGLPLLDRALATD